MINIVVGLPSMIQQQTEVKIKEAEERKVAIQDRTEIVSIKNLNQLMVATILPKFKEEWEDPQFEATKYLAAIFNFWLRNGMFLEQKPNIHSIGVDLLHILPAEEKEEKTKYREKIIGGIRTLC